MSKKGGKIFPIVDKVEDKPFVVAKKEPWPDQANEPSQKCCAPISFGVKIADGPLCGVEVLWHPERHAWIYFDSATGEFETYEGPLVNCISPDVAECIVGAKPARYCLSLDGISGNGNPASTYSITNSDGDSVELPYDYTGTDVLSALGDSVYEDDGQFCSLTPFSIIIEGRSAAGEPPGIVFKLFEIAKPAFLNPAVDGEVVKVQLTKGVNDDAQLDCFAAMKDLLADIAAKPDAMHDACFELEKTTKIGYQVSDFDEADSELGDTVSCNFQLTLPAGSTSVINLPSQYTVTAGTPADPDGDGFETTNYDVTWAWTGESNPEQPITATVTFEGCVGVVSGSDFRLCSGGGESANLVLKGRQWLKEICYVGKPSVYQDAQGEAVDASDLVKCISDQTDNSILADIRDKMCDVLGDPSLPCPDCPKTLCDNEGLITYAQPEFTITSISLGTENISSKFNTPIDGNIAPDLSAFKDALVACLEQRGYTVTEVQGRDGWSLSWNGEQVVVNTTGDGSIVFNPTNCSEN